MVASQVVGGRSVKVGVRRLAGRAEVRVRVVELGQGHGRHPHHVLGAATALEVGWGLAGAADEWAVFA